MLVSTWQQLRDYLARTYPVADGAEGVLAVTVNGAELELRSIEVSGAPWLDVRGLIAKRARVPATSMLKKNFELAIGNLATVYGDLVLRQLLPLEGLPVACVDDTLTVVAAVIAEARSR